MVGGVGGLLTATAAWFLHARAEWLLVTRTDLPGRVVEAGPPEAYQPRMPVLFALDDFYLMPLEDGAFVALYAYPPGYFGHVRGCRIRWEPDATVRAAQAGTEATPVPPAVAQSWVEVTGLWVEGCGGAKWDARGQHVFGPAPRDLDRFPVGRTAAGNLQIDTRRLQCSGSPCERVRALGSGLTVLVMSPAAAPVERVLVPSGGPPNSEPANGGPANSGTVNRITARDISFDVAAVRGQAGQDYHVTLDNRGIALHSWHVLGVGDRAGAPISTSLLMGGQSQTITFTVMSAGTYRFQCDVHPDMMWGSLVIE